MRARAFDSPAESTSSVPAPRCSCRGRCARCGGLVDAALAAPSTRLPAAVERDMGARLGFDFSGVRVHADGTAAASARALDARAYTVGRDIVWGDSAPIDSASGRWLLAHELAHVAQAGGVEGAALARSPLHVAPTSDPLESDADSAADAVVAGGVVAAPLARAPSTPSLRRAPKTPGSQPPQAAPPERDICRSGTIAHGGMSALDPDFPGLDIMKMGNAAHALIQVDFKIDIDPTAQFEYRVPKQDEPDKIGRVDIVTPSDFSMYEIKPASGAAAGDKIYDYAASARGNCDARWHVGTSYPEQPKRIFPRASYPKKWRSFFPGADLSTSDGPELWAWLDHPGVIVYEVRQKQKVPVPVTSPVKAKQKDEEKKGAYNLSPKPVLTADVLAKLDALEVQLASPGGLPPIGDGWLASQKAFALGDFDSTFADAMAKLGAYERDRVHEVVVALHDRKLTQQAAINLLIALGIAAVMATMMCAAAA